MKVPSIPMSPSALPQQRVVEVIDLPSCPNNIDICLYMAHKRKMPRLPSRRAKYLCQAEWAWSPMHSRISSYYIHRGHNGSACLTRTGAPRVGILLHRCHIKTAQSTKRQFTY